jgi:type III pantothenate kinase
VLLTADVGNTEIVLGVFEGEELTQTWRSSTRPERTSDELALLLAGFLEHRGLDLRGDITGMCIASVVPDVTGQFREMAASYLTHEPLIVGPGMKTGVSVVTDNPREVGADRVVNTLAAFTLYGGPAIVVDFGTGTNFDVISTSGEFLGGVIAPGLQISAGALFGRTARLTRVDLQPPRSPIGRSTVELGAPDATVIATGGLAPVVIPHCRTVDHHAPWLTLHGLRLVYEKNVDG